MKMMAGFADIPDHRQACSGQNANTLKRKDKDICIYYQDTRPNVWDALRKDLQDEYTISVSIKTDCLCLQLTPTEGRDDIKGIANCLSKTIAGAVQRLTMERMISRIQTIDSTDTLKILVLLCMARAAQKGFSLTDRTYVKTIELRIVECLETHRHIHLEGFLTFRMRDYLNGWQTCVEDVLQYINTKSEYNAYMEVLRRFYRMQPCRCQRAVVEDMLGGGYLVNADGCAIRVHGRNINSQKQTPEEELMHILLQLAPARIEIHLMRNAYQMAVINTLLLVFGVAVELCE